MIKDDSAQTEVIIFIIIGLFLIGLAYVMLSPLMDENQKANNDLINNTNLPYSQARADTMSGIYDYFKYFPLYALLIFAVYGIKTAIDKQSGQI